MPWLLSSLNTLKERANSLQMRLFVSALFMVLILLPTAGLIINSAFSNQMVDAIESELKAFSYSILAVSEVSEQQLLLPEVLLENQFNVSESGLYAAFSQQESVEIDKQSLSEAQAVVSQQLVWTSPSLLGLELTPVLPAPFLGESQFGQIVLAERTHFIFSFSVSFADESISLPVTLHILKDKTDFDLLLLQFKHQLWLWLIALMVVLLFIQGVWLKYTLKPLRTLRSDVKAIESGKQQFIDHPYPVELQQLADQLNILLKTEQKQRSRYRNALSDLAHSLKTPLAVLQGQEGLTSANKQQLGQINHIIEHQLKRAQSAGQTAWHVGIKIEPIVSKILNSLKKIYHQKQLQFHVNIDQKALFKGDESDLFELLGNVLDNACKAAKKHVVVSIHYLQADKVGIVIEDDGVGILPDQVESILQRGTRVDTYEQGHGIGLAIVRDLVKSYQGELTIERSNTLTGAQFTLVLPC